MTAEGTIPPRTREAWHTMSATQALKRLDSQETGLVAAEAERRREVHGPNVIAGPKRGSVMHLFLRQFRSLLIWILIVAAIIAAVIGDRIDALAILAIVILNAAFGFWQEFTAERSIDALKQLTAPQAKAWRDAALMTLPAAKLVPGDVIELEAGDMVPADARLIRTVALRCVESALTGESESSEKSSDAVTRKEAPPAEQANMVFMGTIVSAGSARAVVTATGMQTEVGRIARLIEAPHETLTPLQRKLQEFGRALVWIAFAIVAMLVAIGIVRGHEPVTLFMTAVSLAVAAVPEGLPAVVTIALALGVLRMARRRALVRSLPAVETLGCTTVICTDKTGTLTHGEMIVRELFVGGRKYHVTGRGYDPCGEILLEGAAADARHAGDLLELATVFAGSNNAHLSVHGGKWSVVGEPTEGALLTAAHKAGARHETIERELPRHHEVPFDSERKRRTVVRRMPDNRLRAFVNGAPELLLDRCSRLYTSNGVRELTEHDREEITRHGTHMSERGLRVLGSAFRDLDVHSAQKLSAAELERHLVFVGLTGMHDAPRAEAKAAVGECHRAGIQVVMITGDHARTALAIARDLGIARDESDVITGAELQRLSAEELQQQAARIKVYARTTPEQKLRIVAAWRANRAVVAMTGDGVNDAPALRGADIGVAMGGQGTEVAKQAADLIVTDDNFGTIVAAVEEGRGIYENIRVTMQYLLASNASELLVMTACVAAGAPLPLLATHLLWINLITDGPPALCLAAEQSDPGLMDRPPREPDGAIADRPFIKGVCAIGVIVAAMTAAVFGYALRVSDVATARSYAFNFLVFSQLLLPFALTRRAHRPRSRWRLIAVVLSLLALQFLVQSVGVFRRVLHTAPIGVWELVALLAVAMLPALAVVGWREHGGRRCNGRSMNANS